MKRLAPILLASFSVAWLAAPVEAQSCPYGVQFTSYGTGCSESGLPPPTLIGGPCTLCAVPCGFSLQLESPVSGCTAFRFIVLGAQSGSFPVPNGCTLLLTPDLFVIPLPGSGVQIPLPADPSLIGATGYAQGILRRCVPGTVLMQHDLSGGLQIVLS